MRSEAQLRGRCRMPFRRVTNTQEPKQKPTSTEHGDSPVLDSWVFERETTLAQQEPLAG